MYIIKMNDDKSLVTTISSTIFQYENNADTLKFFLPPSYENIDFSECIMLLYYITPNNIESFEELVLDPELYKGHCVYRLKVTSALTATPGKIRLWLNAINSRDNIVFKSGTACINIVAKSNSIDGDNQSDSGVIEFDKNTPSAGGGAAIGGDIIHF